MLVFHLSKFKKKLPIWRSGEPFSSLSVEFGSVSFYLLCHLKYFIHIKIISHFSSPPLVIFAKKLKVCLIVITCRTYFRSAATFIQITAVTAPPCDFFIFFEHFISLKIGYKRVVYFLMLFFRNSNCFKNAGNIIKTFLTGSLCKFRIHYRMFIVFTGSRIFKVFKSRTNDSCWECTYNLDLTTFKKLEQPFSMLFFLICGLLKYCRHLHITLFFCLACKIGIAISCLGFSCKRH
mmetsp:Transcript_5147/g.2895  ORF Transcript_5147/g.2895 Transcript_5147/m.2895 type:complete len:235 (-) Transcript_5147:131-835(-)